MMLVQIPRKPDTGLHPWHEPYVITLSCNHTHVFFCFVNKQIKRRKNLSHVQIAYIWLSRHLTALVVLIVFELASLNKLRPCRKTNGPSLNDRKIHMLGTYMFRYITYI